MTDRGAKKEEQRQKGVLNALRKERVRARAREILARVAPAESVGAIDADTLEAFGAATPRALRERLVAELKREIEEPTPSSMTFDRAGKVIDVGYGERHSYKRRD